MKIVVVFPTLGRTDQATRCLMRLRSTAPSVDAIALTETEPNLLRERTGFAVIETDPILTAVQKWNVGARVAVGMGATHLVLGADDLWWGDGWLDEAMAKLVGDVEVVAFNDLQYNGMTLGTHYLVTSRFCREQIGGVLACPHYRSWGLDAEMTDIAKRAGRYVWAERAVVEHRHPNANKSLTDLTYERGRPLHPYDLLMYNHRKEQGFPIDYAPAF